MFRSSYIQMQEVCLTARVLLSFSFFFKQNKCFIIISRRADIKRDFCEQHFISLEAVMLQMVSVVARLEY